MLEVLADGTGFRVRVRYCGTRSRIRIPITDRERAEAIAVELIAMGEALTGDAAAAKQTLERAARLEPAKIRLGTAALKSGRARVKPIASDSAPDRMTIRQLGEEWTSGRLAKKYPDHVKLKSSASKDIGCLDFLCKTIGDLQITAFELADAERAMATLDAALTSATRRHYAQTLSKLLKIAVYPCKLIKHSPLPAGFLPKVKSGKAKSYLYPADDEKLLKCTDVPLARRALYGFLAREGLRLGEALGLTWGDLDLERGAIKLDANKTDDPRAWALTPGVPEALAAFRPAGAKAKDLVFPGIESRRMAEGFRNDLQAAKVERPELFERSKSRQPIRVHDLRATFVTLSLAAGRSESWVADRTGHRSSIMINKYRRAARTAAELQLGSLGRLDELLSGPSNTPSKGKSSGTGIGTEHTRPLGGIGIRGGLKIPCP